MMQKPLVLCLGNDLTDTTEHAELLSLARIEYIRPTTSIDWASALKDFAQEKGSPLCLLTNGVIIKKIGEDLLAPLIPGLRLFASNGAGYDNVDIDWCAKQGVYVSNTPHAVTESTANCAVWLILSCLRDLWVYNNTAKEGKYRDDIKMQDLRDPDGLTLGVVGLGRIGGSLAHKMSVFGMTVKYYSRHRASKEDEKAAGDAEYIDNIDDLLAQSDVVSVHVPLTESTRGLFDAAKFAQMKQNAVFINTSRGPVHDEGALAQSLLQGHLARAGLDVFEKEPAISPEFMIDGELARRVVTTPHIGGFTVQTQRLMQQELLKNVISVLKHDKPVNPVNDPK